MAQIMHIAGATRVLGKSQGYLGLPVKDWHLNVMGVDTPCMTTSWELSPKEVYVLTSGGILAVRLLGSYPHVVTLTLGETNVLERVRTGVIGRAFDSALGIEVDCRLWGFAMTRNDCLEHTNGIPLYVTLLGSAHPPISMFVQETTELESCHVSE